MHISLTLASQSEMFPGERPIYSGGSKVFPEREKPLFGKPMAPLRKMTGSIKGHRSTG